MSLTRYVFISRQSYKKKVETIKKLKGIGGGQGPFFFIILFNLVLTKLQDAFYRF